jgi:hypothetical protein
MSNRPYIAVLPILTIVLLALTPGCESLNEFRTGSKEVFRGKIVGSDTGNQEKSFIRSGFQSYLEMELTFDPYETESSPGTITMKTVEKEPAWFSETPLDPIDPLYRDPLSQYTFPGAGRIRNYIFGARITGQPRSALVFISLMADGEIEARVIAPEVTVADGDGGEDAQGAPMDLLFGLFRLKKAHTR